MVQLSQITSEAEAWTSLKVGLLRLRLCLGVQLWAPLAEFAKVRYEMGVSVSTKREVDRKCKGFLRVTQPMMHSLIGLWPSLRKLVLAVAAGRGWSRARLVCC
jgi:hypothetical protein